MGLDRNTMRKLTTIGGGNNCFGCGAENPHGLRMVFYTDEEALYSWVQPPEHMCGLGSMVHGGILSLILDEIMAWGAAFFTKRLVVTKETTLRFHKPALQGRGELMAKAELVGRPSEREVVIEGKIYQREGSKPCTTAKSVFTTAEVDDLRRLGTIDHALLDAFQQSIDQF